jgi:hypothetical protein
LIIGVFFGPGHATQRIEEMGVGRGVSVDHPAINRRASRFLGPMEMLSRKHKRQAGAAWRMDETYVEVKGVWKYRYRAVNTEGRDRRCASDGRTGPSRVQMRDQADAGLQVVWGRLECARCIELMHMIRKGPVRGR